MSDSSPMLGLAGAESLAFPYTIPVANQPRGGKYVRAIPE